MLRHNRLILSVIIAIIASSYTAAQRRHIYIAAQHPAYYPHYTAALNLSTPESKAELRNAWNQGEYITAAGHTSSGWQAVLSGGARYTNQTFKVSNAFPLGYIESQRAKGFMITSLASDPGSWLVVTSQGSGIKDQHILTAAPEIPEQWSSFSDSISALQAKGFYISEASFHDRYWTIVMSLVDNAPAQHWALIDQPELIPYLTRQREEDFEATIIDADDAGTKLFVVTSADSSEHRIKHNRPLAGLLDDYFYIIYIGG